MDAAQGLKSFFKKELGKHKKELFLLNCKFEVKMQKFTPLEQFFRYLHTPIAQLPVRMIRKHFALF